MPDSDSLASITFKKVTLLQEIVDLLVQFNESYTRSLTERVGDLNVYANKLLTSAEVYIALLNNVPAGYLVIYIGDPSSRAAFISQIAVKPNMQGKGLGYKIMQFSIELSRNAQKEVIRLEVDIDNLSAIKLYSKMGFKHTQPASNVSQYMELEIGPRDSV